MRFETERGEKRRHSQSYGEHFHRVPPLALAPCPPQQLCAGEGGATKCRLKSRQK